MIYYFYFEIQDIGKACNSVGAFLQIRHAIIVYIANMNKKQLLIDMENIKNEYVTCKYCKLQKQKNYDTISIYHKKSKEDIYELL